MICRKWFLLLVVPLLAIYFVGAYYHADHVNTNMKRGDQLGYMHTAEKMHRTHYRYLGDRNRMPLYSWFVSANYRPGMDYELYFSRGKVQNIVFSMFFLVWIFFLVQKSVAFGSALNLIGVTAFTVYVFRAGYIQCEIVYYSLTFTLFFLMIRLIRRPAVSTAILTGIAASLTHLTKSAVLPGVFIFLVFYLGRFDRAGRKNIAKRTISAVVFLIVFLAVIFPYINDSKKIFGHYFYNVNSTFYVWTDSWDEVRRSTRAHGDRVGWPDMPPELIPSPQKYFREHTTKQMFRRVLHGMLRLKNEFAVSYGYQFFVILYLLFAGAAVWLDTRKYGEWIRREFWLFSFVSVYFGCYMILYAWMVPMNGGPRFMLAHFLPLMFVLLVIIDQSFRERTFMVLGRRASWLNVFHLSVFINFCFFANRITHNLMTTYAGN